jgi:hypothetical protein
MLPKNRLDEPTAIDRWLALLDVAIFAVNSIMSNSVEAANRGETEGARKQLGGMAWLQVLNTHELRRSTR